jgi:hypothetical protein
VTIFSVALDGNPEPDLKTAPHGGSYFMVPFVEETNQMFLTSILCAFFGFLLEFGL